MSQQKIRINDLARELEVKSKAILDALPKVGVTEKKTHSSSVSLAEAGRLREYFTLDGTQPAVTGAATGIIRTKIDLSRISRPGDVLKAITAKVPGSRAQAANSSPRLTPGQPIYRRKIATVVRTIPTKPRQVSQDPPPRRAIAPHSGTPPVYGTIQGSSSPATVAATNEAAIEQAERLLRTLRAEEKKNRG